MKIYAICVFLCFHLFAFAEEENTKKFLEEIYPGMVNGCPKYSVVVDLPEGLILRCGKFEFKEIEIKQQITKYPEELRMQIEKNSIFFLEQLVTETILVHAAEKHFTETAKKIKSNDKQEILNLYLREHLDNIIVTETEIARFYEENKQIMGGLSLHQVKSDLKNYLLQEKRKNTIEEVITETGKNLLIEISRKWVAEQIPLIRDNPVDRARYSGKPTLVDFGADGCIPCDMMAPILKKIETKYVGKLNVVFVHVRKEQVLAARFGIQSIPVQIFFDKDGKEVFRHTGFYSEEKIEKKLAEIKVK